MSGPPTIFSGTDFTATIAAATNTNPTWLHWIVSVQNRTAVFYVASSPSKYWEKKTKQETVSNFHKSLQVKLIIFISCLTIILELVICTSFQLDFSQNVIPRMIWLFVLCHKLDRGFFLFFLMTKRTFWTICHNWGLSALFCSTFDSSSQDMLWNRWWNTADWF